MAITKNSQIDLNGNEMILDADGDTTITADTDDQIDFKTGGTDRLTIDASGNVGIGDAAPADKLEVNGGSSYPHIRITSSSNTSRYMRIGMASATDHVIEANGSSTLLYFKTAGSERMRITSDGDFLSRQTSADVYDTNTGGSVRQYWGNQFSAQNNTNSKIMIGSGSAIGLIGGATTNSASKFIVNSYMVFGQATATAGSEAGYIDFYTSTGGAAGTQRVRLDNTGALLVGTTSQITSSVEECVHIKNGDGAGQLFLDNTRSSGNQYMVQIHRLGTRVGSIQTSTSGTSYLETSDYRLKENVNYEFNALERVAQLKPARFNFIKEPDLTVDGFLAHEVSPVVPQAVSGEKDAVDEEGNPDLQGIDHSKLVPLLTKAIQEQQEQIESLQQEIEVLKNGN